MRAALLLLVLAVPLAHGQLGCNNGVLTVPDGEGAGSCANVTRRLQSMLAACSSAAPLVR